MSKLLEHQRPIPHAAELPDHRIDGDGATTALLLHGVYGDRRYFENTERIIAGNGYRVVVWDCPGYGNSPAPEKASIEVCANAAAALVRA